jgi:hypothetical protein
VRPKKLPRYPSDRLVLLEIARQIESAYDRVRLKRRKTWTWPLSIGPYEVKQKMDISTYELEWDEYPL